MTSFANLGLDPLEISGYLETLGIDPSLYTEDELASLMLVANITLEYAISDKASDVEELLFEYSYQAGRLVGMQSTFDRLLETIAVANAPASAAMDFLEGEDTYLEIDDTSVVSLDYSWSWTTGLTSFELESFESLQDLISAVANNETIDYADGTDSIATLYFGYLEGRAEGFFNRVVSSSGNSSSWNNFVSGGNYYLEIDTPIPTYLDLDGFKQYLIAKGLQDAGFIGASVELDPVQFARTSLSGSAFDAAEDFAQWMQLYFGETKIDFDTDAGTLSLTYSGAAALREMGVSLGDYFEEAEPELTNLATTSVQLDLPWYSFDALVSDYMPHPIAEEGGNWLVALTASYVYGNIDSIWTWVPDSEYWDNFTTNFDFFDNDTWSELSDLELTEVRTQFNLVVISGYPNYLNADTLDDLLEDCGSAIQSQSSTGELALVEASTAITEWSELHNGWDTVHKYVTDALGRALALLK